MNKMLVAVFDTEAAAFEGLSALRDLHKDGEITLYATTVLTKDQAGKIAVKRRRRAGTGGHRPRLSDRQSDRPSRRAGGSAGRRRHRRADRTSFRSRQERDQRDVRR